MHIICTGAKSILDIPRTLEVLESNGVAVLAYGVDDFPAFFTRKSGCRAPARVESSAEAAAVAYAQASLGLASGMLVGKFVKCVRVCVRARACVRRFVSE